MAQTFIPKSACKGRNALVRERIYRDLNASFHAWSHLAAHGLTSPIVCAALFGHWSICACGSCGGGR